MADQNVAEVLRGIAELGEIQPDILEILENLAKGPPADDISDIRIAIDLQDVFTLSRMKICTVADKIAAGKLEEDLSVLPSIPSTTIPLPIDRKWNFALGDRVQINCSLRKFKSIQNETIGWKKTLKNLYGHEGIVTGFKNQYRNDVEVYFPDIFTSAQLYPGVLKLSGKRDVPTVKSHWKVGQSVTTMTDGKIARFFQMRLPDVPLKYLGKKGRIVAITSAGVFVTFDERKSYAINPAMLVPGDDAPKFAEKPKRKEFEIGEEVVVSSDLKLLIKNQKDCGGWIPNMSALAGNKVTVVSTKKDGSIFVQKSGSRMWRLNPASVKKLEKIHEVEKDFPEVPGKDLPETSKEDLEFCPGDKVKFKILPNTRMLLASKGIDPTFLEYMRETFLVESLQDTDELVLKMFIQPAGLIWINKKLVRKATMVECEAYDDIQAKVDSLEAGKRVRFDLGPPNYVRAILREIKSPPSVVNALISSALLVGFTDPDRAVIEYENGERYRINKKFLTVPEKLDISAGKESMLSTSMISKLEEAIANCVEIIHKQDESDQKPSVSLVSATMGDPPCVNFHIHSTSATSENVLEKLNEAGWDVEHLEIGHSLIKGSGQEADQPVKIGLAFNGEESYDMPHNSLTMEFHGPAAASVEALPFTEQAVPTPTFAHSDFQYFRLYDHSLARDVYFPYIVHGGRRQAAEPNPPDDRRRSTENTKYSIIGAESVNINQYN